MSHAPTLTTKRLALAVLSALALPALGCATTIPNTTVEDTAENRSVVAFMEDYRKALEERNVRRLLEMASPFYLDDNGTPGGADDVDYDTLRARLTTWPERVDDVRYDISYRRISYSEDDKVYVEVRYGGSFHIDRPATEDEQWSRRLSNHRLILQRLEDPEGEDEYRILSGM